MAPQPVLAVPIVTISTGAQETITLSVPDASVHKVFSLANPDRLVVDMPLIPGTATLPSTYKGKLIKSIRQGRLDTDTSRIVFDLQTPVKILNVEEGDRGLTIAITASRASGKATKSFQQTKKQSKPVVVIDAGHGGEDPGTSGPRGTQEKDVVLTYARALQERMMKSGRYKVVLTREGDRFIRLRKRVELARQAEGDIFISLHADSAPHDDARGLSVYTVSEKASDQEAEALAARENKSDVIAGMDLSEESEDVAGILISLAQRDTKNRSATLADFLVARLGDRVDLLENTHRFAGFAVLKAPDIPSVLIEIGFLSNAAEEKLLKSRSYRDKVVRGIEAGIEAYFAQQRANEGT